MKEIVIWMIVTVVLTVALILIFIVRLVQGKRRLVFHSLILLSLAVGCGVWTAYLFTGRSYNRIRDIFKPRTGNEIYQALFGRPTTNCVRVLQHQDQVIPKIDYAILLHFETCPEELRRILSLHEFECEVVSREGWEVEGASFKESWFKPETLGDSVLYFKYNKDDYGNGQYIFSSLDSTRVFCKDVAD